MKTTLSSNDRCFLGHPIFFFCNESFASVWEGGCLPLWQGNYFDKEDFKETHETSAHRLAATSKLCGPKRSSGMTSGYVKIHS